MTFSNTDIIKEFLLPSYFLYDVKSFVDELENVSIFSQLPLYLIKENIQNKSKLEKYQKNIYSNKERNEIFERNIVRIYPYQYFYLSANIHKLTAINYFEYLEKQGIIYPLYRITPIRQKKGKKYYEEIYKEGITISDNFIRDRFLPQYKKRGQLSFPNEEKFISWHKFISKTKDKGSYSNEVVVHSFYADYQKYSLYLALTSNKEHSQLKEKIKSFEVMAHIADYTWHIVNTLTFKYQLEYIKNWVTDKHQTNLLPFARWNWYLSKFLNDQVEYHENTIPKRSEIKKFFESDFSDDELEKLAEIIWKLGQKTIWDPEKNRLERLPSPRNSYIKEGYYHKYLKFCKNYINGITKLIKVEELKKLPEKMFDEAYILLKDKKHLEPYELDIYDLLIRLTSRLIMTLNILFGGGISFKDIQTLDKPNSACFNCGKVFTDEDKYNLTEYCKDQVCKRERNRKITFKEL